MQDCQPSGKKGVQSCAHSQEGFRANFLPAKQCDFLGKKFSCPLDTEGYLVAQFGPDWRTPVVSLTASMLQVRLQTQIRGQAADLQVGARPARPGRVSSKSSSVKVVPLAAVSRRWSRSVSPRMRRSGLCATAILIGSGRVLQYRRRRRQSRPPAASMLQVLVLVKGAHGRPPRMYILFHTALVKFPRC